MRSSIKRVLSLSLVIAVIFSVFNLPYLVKAESDSGEGLGSSATYGLSYGESFIPLAMPYGVFQPIATYEMESSNFDTNKITDITGNGYDAETAGISATDFINDGGVSALDFGGDKSKYIKLPAGLIESETFSVQMSFKATTGGDHWLLCLGQGEGSWMEDNVGNYIFINPYQANGTMRSGIKQGNRSSEVLLAPTISVDNTDYYEVILTSEQGVIALYVDGVLSASLDHQYSVDNIIPAGDVIGYIGRSLYTADPGFDGLVSSVNIFDENIMVDDQGRLDQSIAALELPYDTLDNVVRGNITLPTKSLRGGEIVWQTTRPEIIDADEQVNIGYDATPAGVVTRPVADTDVTMTATLTYGSLSDTKDFTFTVKAAVAEVTENDLSGYFFTYFAGEKYSDGEQVFFATSEDGLNWVDMNYNDPVLTSSLGEGGVRDPFIIRSPEGDKFYMIATDLRIANGAGWGAAQTAGSQYLMVWESTDLVNWSDQRMVKVARNDAGCTWAPEAHYDEKTGEYIVYWASKISEDNYSKHRMYYSKTRDFYTFTEPEVMMDMSTSVIDTTILETEDTYYRFTKIEGQGYIFQDKVSQLLHESPTRINSTSLESQGGVEGPTSFKFIGEDKWCILLDNYGGIGYYPLVTTDLDAGDFTRLETGFTMPSRARHGTPIRVTSEEYDAVMAKWGPTQVDESGLVAHYPLTSDVSDTSGNDNHATEKNTVSYEDGLTLKGNGYVTLPSEVFQGRENLTISAWIKSNTDPSNTAALFFGAPAVGGTPVNYWMLNPCNPSGNLKSVFTNASNPSSPWSTEVGVGNVSTLGNKGVWTYYTTVIAPDSISAYINGEPVGSASKFRKVSSFGENIEAYIGRSNYTGDSSFKGSFKDLSVYADSMTDEQVKALYGTTGMGSQLLLDQAVAALTLGDTSQVRGNIDLPITGLHGSDITWSSSDTSVITTTGDVTRGDNDETVTLTATISLNSLTDTKAFTVTVLQKEAAPVESVSINENPLKIYLGDTSQLSASITPADASNQNITWSSSNATVVSVDASGIIKGLALGSADITVTTEDLGKTDTISITVKPAPVPITGISVSPSNIELSIGTNQKLTAIIAPDNATDKNVIWSSSDSAIVAADNNGLVTAKTEGAAVITATTANGLSASCSITVKQGEVEVSLYNVRITAGVGGSIVPNTSGDYPEGTSVVVSAKALDNFKFTHWTSSNGGMFKDVKSAATIFTTPSKDTVITAHFEEIKEEVKPPTTEDNSSQGLTGGGSSSGGSSGSANKADTGQRAAATGTSTSSTGTINDTAAKTLITDAVADAKANNEDTAKVKIKNAELISAAALAEINKGASMPVKVYANTMSKDGKSVEVRISFDSKLMSNDINVAASGDSTNAKRAQALFDKWFDNDLQTMELKQGTFEAPVEVAVKIDSKLKMETPVIYLYDFDKNSYKILDNADSWMDGNGYLHFNTSVGGNIIISNEKLQRK